MKARRNLCLLKPIASRHESVGRGKFGGNMFLIDDLLLSPISGFKFVMRTLARAAEEQYTDDTPVKERLLELQTLLEEGEITEDEYVEQERLVLAELREIQNRRMQLAGVTPEEAERMGRPMLELSVPVKQAGEE